jgi:hypothetical protein
MRPRTVPLLAVGLAVLISGCASKHTSAATAPAASASSDSASLAAPAPSDALASSTAAAPVGSTPPDATMTGTVTDAADGISVTLPAGYTRLTDTAQLQAVANAASAPPQLASQIANAGDMFAKGAKIVAYKTPDGAFADNLNIIVSDAAGMNPADIAQAFPAASQILTSSGATVTGHSAVTVGGQPALQVEYTMPASGFTVNGTQVYIVHAGKVFITSISQAAATPNAADVKAIIDSMTFS